MFVILKPVILIVLALAGNAAAAGLSFGYGGALQSVGTILVGVVIYAIAAFSPWTLMFLLGTEVGAMRGARMANGSHAGVGGGGQDDPGHGPGGGAAAGGGLDIGDSSPRGRTGDGVRGRRGRRERWWWWRDGGGFLSSLGGAGGLGSAVSGAAPGLAAAAGFLHETGGRLSNATAARVQVAAGRSGFIPSTAAGSGSFGSLIGGGQPSTSPPPTADSAAGDQPPDPAGPRVVVVERPDLSAA